MSTVFHSWHHRPTQMSRRKLFPISHAADAFRWPLMRQRTPDFTAGTGNALFLPPIFMAVLVLMPGPLQLTLFCLIPRRTSGGKFVPECLGVYSAQGIKSFVVRPRYLLMRARVDSGIRDVRTTGLEFFIITLHS